MHKRTALAAFAAASSLVATGRAEAAQAYIRVIDVGNAMCVLAQSPTGETLLYDTGDAGNTQCAAAVKAFVGANGALDVMVLSHADKDHIGEAIDILKNHRPKLIVHTGDTRTANSLAEKTVKAIAKAVAAPLDDRNLKSRPLPNTDLKDQGAPLTVMLGAAKLTFVAGWHNWQEQVKKRGYEAYKGDLSPSDASENRNAISIVVKYEFGGQSVLLTGDTIGRERDDTDDVCLAAERWMVEDGNVLLKSDVLVGQHHGGDNSSSACFLKAVAPTYVVFPAGNSSNDHPRAVTVARVLALPLPENNIFRTDRSDDEGVNEWAYGRQSGCKDLKGDDDVEIFLSDVPGVAVQVQYREPVKACKP